MCAGDPVALVLPVAQDLLTNARVIFGGDAAQSVGESHLHARVAGVVRVDKARPRP
jgi:hypothetical protein